MVVVGDEFKIFGVTWTVEPFPFVDEGKLCSHKELGQFYATQMFLESWESDEKTNYRITSLLYEAYLKNEKILLIRDKIAREHISIGDGWRILQAQELLEEFPKTRDEIR